MTEAGIGRIRESVRAARSWRSAGIEHRPPVLEVPVLAFAISRALPDRDEVLIIKNFAGHT